MIFETIKRSKTEINSYARIRTYRTAQGKFMAAGKL